MNVGDKVKLLDTPSTQRVFGDKLATMLTKVGTVTSTSRRDGYLVVDYGPGSYRTVLLTRGEIEVER